jgi:hypothetical protein
MMAGGSGRSSPREDRAVAFVAVTAPRMPSELISENGHRSHCLPLISATMLSQSGGDHPI